MVDTSSREIREAVADQPSGVMMEPCCNPGARGRREGLLSVFDGVCERRRPTVRTPRDGFGLEGQAADWLSNREVTAGVLDTLFR